ncbi:MAG: DUF2089 family protein [Phycisphaerae bacterium]|nr:DUF2089 family protein [Phycisphaerae bacterium]
MNNEREIQWLGELEREDIAFIKRFVLASGSLKQVAGEYDISYPTVRLRLDRLIQKIRLLDSQEKVSPFERLCRGLFIDGKIDETTLRQLLVAHETSEEKKQ